MSLPAPPWPPRPGGPYPASSPRPGPPPPPRTAPRPPRSVLVALGLVAAGIVSEVADEVGFVVEMLGWRGVGALSFVAPALWTVVVCVVLGGLGVCVWRGLHGGRLALTVLGAGWVLTGPAHVAPNAFSASVLVLQCLLVVAALVLLYVPPSSAWFTRETGPVGPWAGPPGLLPGVPTAVRRARAYGWQVLGLVLGLGLPAAGVWAFLAAWWASDGCSTGSTDPECTTGGFAVLAGGPFAATVVGAALTVVGIALATTRPRAARRWVHAGLASWFGVGLVALAVALSY